MSREEEILLPHPALCICLAFRFSQARHFTNLLSSMRCGCWVEPGRSYHPMEHPTELTCERTSSLYGHQAAHWKWSSDVESWLFALLGKAPRYFKSICLPAVRQECSVLSSFLPNVRQEGKFLEDISKPIFKCILSHQPYRIYLPRAIVCNSVQCFFSGSSALALLLAWGLCLRHFPLQSRLGLTCWGLGCSLQDAFRLNPKYIPEILVGWIKLILGSVLLEYLKDSSVIWYIW